MRAWLVVCAALALAPCRATAARPPQDAARLERIKSHILAKLGLTSRPTPQGAPPHDVVRQILARAADPQPRVHPDTHHDNEHAMREIIAIAHRDFRQSYKKLTGD
ncbi:uncharacterized protein LOC131843102 isoform X2 [Achroia grisella]|uniref:uncharacterized protein LOC131843102 isoform X2 n=1 Tax=Achroia grisella TaxID=688607 RepID=UPI0027D30767|nr:uncharacterized protein LOC131843102 isoform X2 [Achroia grisella]